MASSLTWSALLLAALAAVACWGRAEPPQPGCDPELPTVGPRVCCERHRLINDPTGQEQAMRPFAPR